VSKTVAVTAVSLALFVAIAIRVTGDQVPWLDTRILELVPPGNEPNSFSRVCDAFLVAGIAFMIIVVPVTALALVVRKRWRPAFFWCLTFAGLLTFDVALKQLFERPSIHSSGEYSFPSGNALASMGLLVAAAALIRGVPRRLFAVGGIVVAAYGGALVYLSWHYPSDVVGGWLLAVAWVGFLALVVRPPPVLDAGALGINVRRRPAGDAPNRLGLRGE
jgi:undecaprenyl-diphosphatase